MFPTVRFVVAWILAAAGTLANAETIRLAPIALQSLGVAAQPSVAVDAVHSTFVLSWQARLPDGCAALRVAELSVLGKLGRVHEVARGCDWFVNSADFPALVVADNGDWLIHWLQKTSADTYSYGIRLSRSTDRGQTWSEPIVPHRDNTPTEHGFMSMAAVHDDVVMLLWLDGRHTAQQDEAADQAHDHAHEGPMSLRSALVGRDGLLREEAEIDARVCSCCGTDLLRAASGEHVAIFRDRSGEEVRDIAVARRAADGWRAEGLVHADGWKIAACPVNGPALAEHGDTLAAAWTTMIGERLSVRVRILDHGRTFGVIEEGSTVAGRVDLAAMDTGWLLSWVGDGALRLASLDKALQQTARVDVSAIKPGRNVGFPRLAALDGRAVLVWTDLWPEQAPINGRAATVLRAVHIRP